MRARFPILLAAFLWGAAFGNDRLSDWIDATILPPLAIETSVEVVDRKGDLLRAYTVADGRWRMAVDLGDVDKGFVAMLLGYEDKRFYRHTGVDAWAMARAVVMASSAATPMTSSYTSVSRMSGTNPAPMP